MLRAFEPIWLLAAIGYAARRWRLLGDTAVTALGWFVFHLAMPAALYVRLAHTSLNGFDGRELGAFAASLVAAIGVGWYCAARFFDRKHGERAVWGMASGYGNAANLGIPLAMQVLGNISFLVEVLLLQTLIVSPIILAALDRHSASGGELRIRRIATLPLRNPVILGSALGIAASATGFHVTPLVQTPLKMLATTAVPAALIALGASLYRREATTDVGRAEISLITGLKLIAQPALACAAGLALHLSQPELLAVVVCAGLPTAQNTFVFAQQYNIGVGLASRAVIVTTTLSLATIAAAAALLGH
ncbi:MAG: AEC family transporter [Streptosporangiaceae bacterium]